MDADVQRIYDFVLRQEQKHLAYRWNGTSLIVYTCDNEGEWNGQLGCGSVTEVLRSARNFGMAALPSTQSRMKKRF